MFRKEGGRGIRLHQGEPAGSPRSGDAKAIGSGLLAGDRQTRRARRNRAEARGGVVEAGRRPLHGDDGLPR